MIRLDRSTSWRPVAWRTLPLLALALALGACEPTSVASRAPYDVRDRHPIVVEQGPVVLDLDVAPGARELTARQRAEIAAFARIYRTRGEGPVTIHLPGGPHPTRAVVGDIRRALSGAGAAHITVAGAPASAPPDTVVQLAFLAPVAKTHACGLWPDGGEHDPTNSHYYNFGCASQTNLAAQVADPRDLATPRPTDRVYATRRQTVVEKYGKGEATATQYPDEDKGRISDVGN